MVGAAPVENIPADILIASPILHITFVALMVEFCTLAGKRDDPVVIHQREGLDLAIQHPVGRLDVGHEFAEDPEARRANAVVVIGRQAVEVFGREKVVEFGIRNRDSFHEHLGADKVDGVIPPQPARGSLASNRQRSCALSICAISELSLKYLRRRSSIRFFAMSPPTGAGIHEIAEWVR
jgi:hypothetical protein